MAKAKPAPKNKKLVYIHKDVLPLLSQEKNVSKLINELLKSHYTNVPAGIDLPASHLDDEFVGSLETYKIPETTESPSVVVNVLAEPQVTKSETPKGLVDGRIDDSDPQVVDGRIAGGDQTDGAVWN